MKLSVVFEYIDRAMAPIRRTEQVVKRCGRSINLAQGCLWKFNQMAELAGRVGETMNRLMQPGVEFEQLCFYSRQLSGTKHRRELLAHFGISPVIQQWE